MLAIEDAFHVAFAGRVAAKLMTDTPCSDCCATLALTAVCVEFEVPARLHPVEIAAFNEADDDPVRVAVRIWAEIAVAVMLDEATALTSPDSIPLSSVVELWPTKLAWATTAPVPVSVAELLPATVRVART
jgi:hypothetical protein